MWIAQTWNPLPSAARSCRQATTPRHSAPRSRGFASRFAEHLANEGVDTSAVASACIILRVDRLGLHCDVAATDDRGVEHKANVL